MGVSIWRDIRRSKRQPVVTIATSVLASSPEREKRAQDWLAELEDAAEESARRQVHRQMAGEDGAVPATRMVHSTDGEG